MNYEYQIEQAREEELNDYLNDEENWECRECGNKALEEDGYCSRECWLASHI